MGIKIKYLSARNTDSESDPAMLPELSPADFAEEGDFNVDELSPTLPVLAMRNAILFQGSVLPVTIGREKSKALIRHVSENGGYFVAAMQRNSEVEDPSIDDLYKIGTLARIIKVLKMPDNTITVVLQGKMRMQILKQTRKTPFLRAEVAPLAGPINNKQDEQETKAIVTSIRETTEAIVRQSNLAPEAIFAIHNIEDDLSLVNFIASTVDLNVADKQAILECNSVHDCAMILLRSLTQYKEFLNVKSEIETRVRKDIDKQQREYVLQEQIRTIQDELGENPVQQQLDEYRQRAAEKKWNDDVAKVFNKELEKLERTNPNQPEFSVSANYIETILDLPWGEYSEDNFDIDSAEARLNQDHYGLEKVKERILEHLAVLKLKGDLKSPIICLVGPPGVGKTSLGRSIAEALGRKYVRISLGGVHDEAEIRGHRRTYIGAMPGRIIQSLKKAGSSNPVFILDEVDKLSNDFHGDPQSALLEVLDPEQNSAFHDNYLDLDYDLSKVMFIATANSLSQISQPLLDRMEIIEVSGYVMQEKIEIARRHLLPNEKNNHGINAESKFTIDDDVMGFIIERYTRESGVRELEKVLASICRKSAINATRGKKPFGKLTKKKVVEVLGIEKYNHDIWQSDLPSGVVTGLAWTAVGGEILFVEASTSHGTGKITLTGNLGDVMKESATLALEYVRSNATLFGLSDVNFDQLNLHIHVPEGAIPKDGPSAGITMVSSIVSALTKRRVRPRVAMTGEITLRGRVLPVGGIKEKILAAKRAGITEIILSEENKRDILDIMPMYLEGVKFHYVKEIREVVELALEDKPHS
ncbi:MAG: endopeptidase La [Bacteroidales bacterium]|jgi:ATP-dependent Lon protease|nr:endopeptidase La [Bacteroidales bacterium]